MVRKRKAFTLIETLIVVVIIGILAALFIPQIMNAVQKAKQKGTMQDMNSIAKAMLDYVADSGVAPEQNGAIAAMSDFDSALSPFYLKAMPVLDQWGTPFYIYCGTAIVGSGIGGVEATGADDFIIISYGRDRQPTALSYDPQSPSSVYFETSDMRTFNQDLAIWNGYWIHVPRSAQIGN